MTHHDQSNARDEVVHLLAEQASKAWLRHLKRSSAKR